MKTGVYIIKNNQTKNVRVGSATNMPKRFSTYKAELRKGKGNKLMLEDLMNYGQESFEYITLEECSVEDLFKREQFWLNEYSDCCMYNKNRVVNVKKKVLTEEEAEGKRIKRSIATSGEKNGNCTVLTEQLASEILWLKNNTKMKQCKIAEMYGCKNNVVNRVGKDRWVNVIATKPNWFTEESEIKIKKIVSIGVDATSAYINI
ncbi:GIY-YIG nuclease family protein [Clostridium lacusfryxellense]|uniref:GIY-YIG nuclease family protein n=1 Tax=Clostridium lacusfryxellense TaxID=205328 RepID=UPI001C0B4657|nr:GIY-YIG nuclease family protein [Clostridium lacusfryxellense]MBU3112136.1 GIY-YIG nuclease family protein [Clostridium lacusfryxellense]